MYMICFLHLTCGACSAYPCKLLSLLACILLQRASTRLRMHHIIQRIDLYNSQSQSTATCLMASKFSTTHLSWPLWSSRLRRDIHWLFVWSTGTDPWWSRPGTGESRYRAVCQSEWRRTTRCQSAATPGQDQSGPNWRNTHIENISLQSFKSTCDQNCYQEAGANSYFCLSWWNWPITNLQHCYIFITVKAPLWLSTAWKSM